ncbi:MAG: hypothetical protein NDP24_00885 [Crenarchaeota archaeon]|nr:hypothetical protein [Thermoproteota archaeon]MCR8472412.1 hypothetical protein [Thermoproteota archaeon]
MQAVKPKRMVKILGREISLLAIYRIAIVLMLSASLVLPWTQMTVSFVPPSLKSNAIEGYLQFRVYPIGIIHNETHVDLYDITGLNKNPVYLLDVLFAGFITIFGLFAIALVIINILLLLVEFKPIKHVLAMYRRMELFNTLLGLALLVAYVYANNLLPVGETNVCAFKVDLWRQAKSLMSTYKCASYNYNIDWGVGLILLFICVISNLIMWVDKYVFVEKYNLSNWWRFRGHMTLLSLICAALPIAESIVPSGFLGVFKMRYYIWSPLSVIVVNVSDIPHIVSMLPPMGILLMILILAAWSYVVFTLGAKSLPSKYLMLATPFISLTLPDDELARRHKMLPIVTEWHRLMGLKLSILAFIIIALMYLFLVHGFGFAVESIAIEIEEAGGIFSTTFSAKLLAILIIAQALSLFRPTR